MGRGITRLQASVEAAVRELGHECVSEGCVQGMSVDIWVPAAGLALEVDGPLHFAANRPQHALGPTRLKRRLLRRCGVRAVALPFYEWKAREPAERLEYLRQLLDDGCGAGEGCMREGRDAGLEVAQPPGALSRARGTWHGWGGSTAEGAAASRSMPPEAEPKPLGVCSSVDSGVSDQQERSGGDDGGEPARVDAARVNLLQYQQGRLSKQQLLKRAALRQIKAQRRPQCHSASGGDAGRGSSSR